MKESKRHLHARLYGAAKAIGPFRHLNSTKRLIPVKQKGKGPAGPPIPPSVPKLPEHPWAAYIWRSRDNRKGRHALSIDPDFYHHEMTTCPKPTNTWRNALFGILKMFVRYPVWDVSYDVAIMFTIGSMVWVVNGFFVWFPIVAPSTEFPHESKWGGGWTGFVGATVFEVGSVLLMIEAVNENRTDCFGWALEETADGFRHLRKHHRCRHHHALKRSLVSASPLSEHADYDGSQGPDWAARTWSWWPTWYELRTHYIREIGFLACSAQFAAATIFWISGFTGLPGINGKFSRAAENWAYWFPQVLGGSGFIISSLLFMVEAQPRWYIMAPGVLGWQMGFWNLIGSIGFTMCGAIGLGGSRKGVQYALTLSTFVGSWAFLIGSIVQWFESLEKYTVWIGPEARQLGDADKGSVAKPASSDTSGNPSAEAREDEDQDFRSEASPRHVFTAGKDHPS